MMRWFVLVVTLLLPSGVGGQSALGLEEVVRAALATHPSVEAARWRAGAAELAVGEVEGALRPSLWATALATRFQEPMVVAPLHGIDVQHPPAFDRTLLQGHVSAEWTLFDGGQRRSRVEGAAAQAHVAIAAAHGTEDDVVVAAVRSYLEVMTARAVLAAHERQREALGAERERAARMYEEGRAPWVQVLRTDAALSRAEADRETAAERLTVGIHRLARVSGMDPERVEAARLVPVAPSPVPLPSRDALLAAARTEHPAVVAAEQQIRAAFHARAGARSQWFPRVGLTGRYSAYGSANDSFAPEWQAGAQVSYPVFVGGSRLRATDRADAELRAARAARAAVVQSVEDGVDASLAAFRASWSRVVALEAAVTQSEEVARIEALALEAGAGVQTDYLRAEAELLAARAALAEARARAVEARIGLARASGRVSPATVMDLLVEVER
jgi:outer membrane protein